MTDKQMADVIRNLLKSIFYKKNKIKVSKINLKLTQFKQMFDS